MKRKSENTKKSVKKLSIIFILFLIFIFGVVKCQNSNIKYNTEKNSIIAKITMPNKSLYNIKDLNVNMLKGKPLILNIYNIKDFSYIFKSNVINNIEQIYKNKLAIIDIIIDDENLDKNLIINYILKNNIKRPIISLNKNDLEGFLENNADMAVIIGDEKGNIKNILYSEQINESQIKDEIDLLLSNKKVKNNQAFDLSLEKDKTPESFIKSLTFIKYLRNMQDTNEGPYFIVSDSEGKRIYFIKLNGEIAKQVGSGKTGKDDLIANNASFCYPSGLAINNDKTLYIADMCNNSIREVELKTLKTSTLISDNELLQKPISLEILDNNLIIATGAKNTLLSYNFDKKSLDVIQCDNCFLGVKKLLKYNNKLYFINKSDANIYIIDKDLSIKKYKEIKNFKEYDIDSFNIDETGIYFVDKYNNKILKLNNEDKLEKYSLDMNEKIYNLPTDIIDLKDKLYITNDGDKKIIDLDKNTKAVNAVSIKFGYEYNKLKTMEGEFLDVNNAEEIKLKSGQEDNKILINLKDTYQFEKMAPQSVSIFEEDKANSSAILIKSYSKNDIINNNKLILPVFEDNKTYYIKGSFYYCGKDKETPCLINNYFKKVVPENNALNIEIKIDFLY